MSDDYGYSDLGIPIGVTQTGDNISDYGRGDLRGFAMGALAQQRTYQPYEGDISTGTTPWKKMDIASARADEPRDPTLLDPATNQWLGQQAADVLLPHEPWEWGLAAMGPAGRIAGKIGKMGAVAAGAYGSMTDEAQAGKARLFTSPFSNIGHFSPVHDAEYLLRARDVTRPYLPAAAVEGSYLLPLAGDRAAANADILGIGGHQFDMPTWLQGGRDYPLEMAGKGAAWASEKSAVSRLLGRANEVDAPVHGVYSAMGERSIDFSHHVSDTLTSMARNSPITDAGLKKFDGVMREADPGWPGLLSDRAHDYLASAPGGLRVKLAKEMDKAEYRDAGFPRVDQARFAATDPGLIDVPTGASGGSVSRLTGGLANTDARHRTYRSVMGGDYQGQFGNVPVEVMFPDLVKAHLAKRANDMPAMSQAERNAAHVSMFMKAGNDVPMLQKANPEWVDRVSRWQELNRMGDLARFTP